QIAGWFAGAARDRGRARSLGADGGCCDLQSPSAPAASRKAGRQRGEAGGPGPPAHRHGRPAASVYGRRASCVRCLASVESRRISRPAVDLRYDDMELYGRRGGEPATLLAKRRAVEADRFSRRALTCDLERSAPCTPERDA